MLIMKQNDVLSDEELENLDLSDLQFGHAYLKYSHWRVKEVFAEWGIELRPYYTWYKAMRYRDCQSYVLIDKETNEIIGDKRGYDLYSLSCFLAQNHIPLKKSKSKRSEGCVRFLEAVEKL